MGSKHYNSKAEIVTLDKTGYVLPTQTHSKYKKKEINKNKIKIKIKNENKNIYLADTNQRKGRVVILMSDENGF